MRTLETQQKKTIRNIMYPLFFQPYLVLISFFFSHPIHYPRTLLSRSLPVVTQTRGNEAGHLLPPPHYGTCHHFYRDNNSAFSSPVNSRRIVPSYAATRSQQPILFYVPTKIATTTTTNSPCGWAEGARGGETVGRVLSARHRPDLHHQRRARGAQAGADFGDAWPRIR